MEENSSLEFASFFKALADPNRLKIIGLLANQPLTVEQLAAMLNLGASTISHHLSKLSELGLVSARAEGYYSIYQLESEPLNSKFRRMLEKETLTQFAADVNLDSYEQIVVKNFSQPDGRLKTIPAQRKKLTAILHHIVRSFDPGKRYPEKQVNDILRRFHDDTATLRRELIGSHLMDRKDGEYWRTDVAI